MTVENENIDIVYEKREVLFEERERLMQRHREVNKEINELNKILVSIDGMDAMMWRPIFGLKHHEPKEDLMVATDQELQIEKAKVIPMPKSEVKKTDFGLLQAEAKERHSADDSESCIKKRVKRVALFSKKKKSLPFFPALVMEDDKDKESRWQAEAKTGYQFQYYPDSMEERAYAKEAR